MIKTIIAREKKLDRWSNGIDHHPKSIELMKFLMEIDYKVYKDHFCWKKGGDGDNGEELMYQMDAFFEAKDKGEL
jgi:hypothetical protein